MDSQQPYKSSEKIIEEEIMKRQLEFPTSQLERSLYKMAKKVNEKVNNKFEIGEYSTEINLRCNESGKEPMQCGGYIKTSFYIKDKNNKYKVSDCLLDPQFYKTTCTDYSGKSFELFNFPQNISFIYGIIEKILSTLNIAYPGVLKHMDNQDIRMIGDFSIYPDNTIKENPEIITYISAPERDKYFYVFGYNKGRYSMNIVFYFKDPNKP